MPRFIILVKATPASEGKGNPATKTLEAIGAFNEEMNAAGILLGGEGLRPTSEGYRVQWTANADVEPEVTQGPFDIKKGGVVSGWWIVRTKDVEEAVAWAKKIPFRGTQDAEVEVRRISEPEDFGAGFTEELQEREEKLRQEIEGK